jgi:hypothetical protein
MAMVVGYHRYLRGGHSGNCALVGPYRPEALTLVWERDGDGFYARVESMGAGTLCYLVVELLPDGGWDWQVWRQGEGAAGARFGFVGTRQEAMWTAECVAAAF